MDVYFRSCPRDVRVTTLIFIPSLNTKMSFIMLETFRLPPSRLHTGSAVARQLLAAEAVVGTWPSVDLAAAIRKLASVALKARRQNELSLIRARMVRSGKATQRFISRTVKPYRAPREHYAFIADCIHR